MLPVAGGVLGHASAAGSDYARPNDLAFGRVRGARLRYPQRQRIPNCRNMYAQGDGGFVWVRMFGKAGGARIPVTASTVHMRVWICYCNPHRRSPHLDRGTRPAKAGDAQDVLDMKHPQK